jgi:6-phosphogluconate dehydrogenase
VDQPGRARPRHPGHDDSRSGLRARVSAVKEERVAASKELPAPQAAPVGDKAAFVADIRKALYASKICSYAQGFQLMRAAASEFKWDLNYGRSR